jgi:hypothetical protein
MFKVISGFVDGIARLQHEIGIGRALRENRAAYAPHQHFGSEI